MEPARVGVNCQDIGLPDKAGLRRASAMGFRAVELPAMSGVFAPADLSSSGRRHVKRFVSGLGLRLVSLVADFPALRLTNPLTIDERIGRTREIIDLAADLDVPVVTTLLDTVTETDSEAVLPLATEALGRLAEAADARNRVLALRPSHDSGAALINVLSCADGPAIGVCFDPAEMVIHGAHPLACFDKWAARIALVHVRDATSGDRERAGRETHLGGGEVDLAGILRALSDSEYRGAFILRRTDSGSPERDLMQAMAVFNSF